MRELNLILLSTIFFITTSLVNTKLLDQMNGLKKAKFGMAKTEVLKLPPINSLYDIPLELPIFYNKELKDKYGNTTNGIYSFNKENKLYKIDITSYDKRLFYKLAEVFDVKESDFKPGKDAYLYFEIISQKNYMKVTYQLTGLGGDIIYVSIYNKALYSSITQKRKEDKEKELTE